MYTWSKRDAIWVNQEVGFKLVKKSVCLVRYSYVLGEYEDYSGREVEVSSTWWVFVYKYVEFIDMVEWRLERLIGLEVSELLRPSVW